MKLTSLRDGGIVVTTMLMASTGVSSAGLDCTKVSADGQTFNLWSLRGPHSVSTWRENPPKTVNTTYTVDICRGLKMKGDVSKERQCAQGTRVCALQHLWDPKGEDKEELMGVVPIAGELLDQGGGDLNVKATLLSTSDSDTDRQKKGVRLTLHGGYYPMTGNDRIEQRAIIDFVCDSRDGTEGEWDPEDKYDDDYGDSDKGDNKGNIRKREDEGDGNKDKQEESPRSKERQLTRDENPALVFESYGYEGNDEKTQILRMTWYTKAACARDDTGGDQSKESRSWGFFSWVVILAFLAIASYLIFGSWLNYNRYGARGWDLVPHGDAIRDVPYLLKDWGRRVLNTVQGGGSRGGYSAV